MFHFTEGKSKETFRNKQEKSGQCLSSTEMNGIFLAQPLRKTLGKSPENAPAEYLSETQVGHPRRHRWVSARDTGGSLSKTQVGLWHPLCRGTGRHISEEKKGDKKRGMNGLAHTNEPTHAQVFTSKQRSSHASNREPNEDGSVPQSMAQDYGRKPVGKKPVEPAPGNAAHHGGHDKHEVQRCHMHQRVAGGGKEKTHIGIVAQGETTLHISAPENLLGRPDEEEQQGADEPRTLARLHAIDEVYLRTGKGEEPRTGLVAYPKDTPQGDGDGEA